MHNQPKNPYQLTQNYSQFGPWLRQQLVPSYQKTGKQYFDENGKPIIKRKISVTEIVLQMLIERYVNNGEFVFYGSYKYLLAKLYAECPYLKYQNQDQYLITLKCIQKAMERLEKRGFLTISRKSDERYDEDIDKQEHWREIRLNMDKILPLISVFDVDLDKNEVYKSSTRFEKKVIKKRFMSSKKGVAAYFKANKDLINLRLKKHGIHVNNVNDYIQAYVKIVQSQYFAPNVYLQAKKMKTTGKSESDKMYESMNINHASEASIKKLYIDPDTGEVINQYESNVDDSTDKRKDEIFKMVFDSITR